jgi:hypothetical protein
MRRGLSVECRASSVVIRVARFDVSDLCCTAIGVNFVRPCALVAYVLNRSWNNMDNGVFGMSLLDLLVLLLDVYVYNYRF